MRKTTKLLALLLAVVMILGLTACGAKDPAPTGNAPVADEGETYTLKIAHVNSTSHPAHIALEKFKETVETATNGKVVVDIYDSAVLGGELEEIQQVIDGTLTSAMVYGMSNWQTMVPETAIEELPFMYPDAESARAAFDGEYGDYVKENWIEPTGVKVLCFWESGFRHFTNNVRPIVEPADMAGIKFRSAQSEIRVKMFEALGATATIISFSELYTALQQGTVEGQENPLSIITANNFFEVQKYLSLSGHFYSTALFIVNPDFWASLPEEYQTIIQSAAEEGRDYDRQLSTEATDTMIQTCKDNGMEVNEIDAEAFKTQMSSVWDLYTDKYGVEAVNLALTSSGQDPLSK